MSHRRICLLVAMLLPAMLWPARALLAADPTPDDVLKAAGLTKVGIYYLLDSDKKLPGFLRDTQALKKKVDDSNGRRRNLEHDLDSAISTMNNLDAQNQAETDKLDHMSKDAYASYNRQVDKVNAIRANLRDGVKFVEKRQATLQELPDPTDEYVAQVIKFADAMDKVKAQYELAADDGVTKALATINTTAKPAMKLGPSEWFQHEYAGTQKLRASVNNATIQFEFIGGVPQVPVIINGDVKIDMVVDSGAAIVALTTETANKLGLKPSDSDQVIKLTSADGKITEAHLMTLKSIRLGNFTVENVQCAIQPPDVKGEMNLLGGTFLRHFVYKMDLTAGALKISQLAEEDPKSSPTTQPAAAGQHASGN